MLRSLFVIWFVNLAVAAGCGTTRWTDTKRTATEQLLISDAVDRAISQIDFGVLAGREVYLETKYLDDTVDKNYLISTLRQHILASGCVLKEKVAEATYIVEARSGGVGTDRQDLLYGVPATSLPTVPLPGVPSQIPEIAMARRTDQQAVAKIAVFAFHKETGVPVWQSGTEAVASRARDLWMFGAGPFQSGEIYEGQQFAGKRLPRLVKKKSERPPVRVARETVFAGPQMAQLDRMARLPDAAKSTSAAPALSPDAPAATFSGTIFTPPPQQPPIAPTW